MTTNWLILLILIAVGGYDLYLALKKKRTLSQRVDMPKRTKHIVLISCLVASWALFGGIDTFLPVVIGTIMGHLLWDE